MPSEGKMKLRAWADARAYPYPDNVVGLPKDILDALLIWRMMDPRYVTRATRVKGIDMQRQWTIEARADFADQEKNEAISNAVRTAAVHINATIALLSDGIKPQVVAFSDDFFTGHEEIALLPDTLGQGLATVDAGEEADISSEMLAAVREMEPAKK